MLKSLILYSTVTLLWMGCAQRVLVEPIIDSTRHKRIAVLGFESNSMFSNFGSEMADAIVVHLVHNAPGLEIVERSKIEDVLREQQLKISGALKPQTTVHLKKVLGISLLLTGSFSTSVGETATPLHSTYAINATTTATLHQEHLTRTARGVCTVRLIEVETGKILWAKRFEDSSSTYSVQTHHHRDLPMPRTDGELVEDVIKTISFNIARNFWKHEEFKW